MVERKSVEVGDFLFRCDYLEEDKVKLEIYLDPFEENNLLDDSRVYSKVHERAELIEILSKEGPSEVFQIKLLNCTKDDINSIYRLLENQ